MPPSIVVLTCPVCAAPIRPESARCDFCGSVVVIQTDHPRLDPHLLNKAMIDQHIAKFRVTVRRDPNDETAHYGLGVAYFNLGLMEDAAEELAQAARLMPENPHIQLQLAIVYAGLAKSGQTDARKAAWTRLDRALLLQPKLVDALLLKADLQLSQDEPLAAVATWRQAETAEPDSVRESIVRFLVAHKMVLRRSPWFSADAARAVYEAAVAPKRQFFNRLTLWSFVGFGVLFLIVGVGSNNVLLAASLFCVMLAATIGFLQYGKRQWPLESPELIAAWEACDARRRHLVTPQAQMAELFAAADYTASQLANEIERQRVQASATNASGNGFAPARPAAWETCEIKIKEIPFQGSSFIAEASGPSGRYVIDRGCHGFRSRRSAERCVKQLQTQLMIEGWEPLPKGNKWWSYRFRRPSR
ncbi:MAG TPA: hypothetical protein VFQ80_15345 [Thermomicrobiales bacterium]|jgi:tetratricopeptide (TPR) repeat protein|nr:hypothetical protein [Thermomicrobiales bacterium]